MMWVRWGDHSIAIATGLQVIVRGTRDETKKPRRKAAGVLVGIKKSKFPRSNPTRMRSSLDPFVDYTL